jgi:mono/diheme cytochrome c family protein
VFSGERTNPKVEGTVAWDSPETKALFDRACADCHSHETRWPWYSYVAPISWYVIHDVEEAREHFNVSSRDLGDADEAAEEVEKGKMPLDEYVKLHSEAKLSDAERAALIAGLKKTFGAKHDEED